MDGRAPVRVHHDCDRLLDRLALAQLNGTLDCRRRRSPLPARSGTGKRLGPRPFPQPARACVLRIRGMCVLRTRGSTGEVALGTAVRGRTLKMGGQSRAWPQGLERVDRVRVRASGRMGLDRAGFPGPGDRGDGGGVRGARHFWPRLAGRNPAHIAARAGLLLGVNLLVLFTAAATQLNAQFLFFAGWSDLQGASGSKVASTNVSRGGQASTAAARKVEGKAATSHGVPPLPADAAAKGLLTYTVKGPLKASPHPSTSNSRPDTPLPPTPDRDTP